MQGSRLAYSVAEFAALAGLSTDLAYDEIKRGALRARKARARTVILDEDARAYLRALPHLPCAEGAIPDIVASSE